MCRDDSGYDQKVVQETFDTLLLLSCMRHTTPVGLKTVQTAERLCLTSSSRRLHMPAFCTASTNLRADRQVVMHFQLCCLADKEARRMTSKDMRQQVAAKLQRCPKSIKHDVKYAIDKFTEDIGFGDEEEDATAEAAATLGAHANNLVAICSTGGLGLGCTTIASCMRCVVSVGVGARLISWGGGATTMRMHTILL